jgi:hypothetical protein
LLFLSVSLQHNLISNHRLPGSLVSKKTHSSSSSLRSSEAPFLVVSTRQATLQIIQNQMHCSTYSFRQFKTKIEIIGEDKLGVT